MSNDIETIDLDSIKLKDTNNVRIPKISEDAKSNDVVKVIQAYSVMEEDGANICKFGITIDELKELTKLMIYEADDKNPCLDEVALEGYDRANDRFEELIDKY